jgi:hypothetical protein
MNRSFQRRVARFYRVPQLIAFYVRTVAQFLIGLYIFAFLALKALNHLGLWPDRWLGAVHATPVLAMVSAALLAAAAVELAYMLFTPGPDEAIDPLILGLAGTTILALSHHEQAASESQPPAIDELMNGGLVVLLIAGLLLLFFLRWKVRQWFADEDETDEEAPAAALAGSPALQEQTSDRQA